MTTTNQTTERTRDSQLIVGIGKHLGSVTSVTLNGVSYTTAQIVTHVQRRLQLLDAAEAARAKARDAVAANKQDRKDFTALLRALRGTIVAMFGTSSEVLTDFGFAPRAARKPTAATKAEAAAKRDATRKARNTLGKRQKAKITGSAATPPVTNGTTGATAAPAPQK